MEENEALSPFLDALYWTLVERLVEFISTPLAGAAHAVAGVVRPRVSTARVFVFDGNDLSTIAGIDCPLLDRAGEQIDHYRHVAVLRRAMSSLACGAIREQNVDSRGIRIFDADSFYDDDENHPVMLRDAVFGSVAPTLRRPSAEPPSVGAQIIHPVGFLTLDAHTVRVYFRDPNGGETCGYDVATVDAAGNFKAAAGGFLTARIRELVGTGTLAGREVSADSDEYCVRAFAVL